MSTSPIVSVCVAFYNHARFPAMLDGILGQTFRDFEIVVVDDGSTDNSLEVLQGYAHRNPVGCRHFALRHLRRDELQDALCQGWNWHTNSLSDTFVPVKEPMQRQVGSWATFR